MQGRLTTLLPNALPLDRPTTKGPDQKTIDLRPTLLAQKRRKVQRQRAVLRYPIRQLRLNRRVHLGWRPSPPSKTCLTPRLSPDRRTRLVRKARHTRKRRLIQRSRPIRRVRLIRSKLIPKSSRIQKNSLVRKKNRSVLPSSKRQSTATSPAHSMGYEPRFYGPTDLPRLDRPGVRYTRLTVLTKLTV